jgi:outer membrane receptor protein involved in Fe transport
VKAIKQALSDRSSRRAMVWTGLALAITAQNASGTEAKASPDGAEADTAIIVTASPLSDPQANVLDQPLIDKSRPQALSDLLGRYAPGVSVSDMQGSPLSMDVHYHGFTSSPVLGTAQGLSVWMDGVRLNQPFGDGVNWDLIPTGAISSIGVVSGAAPQFGRNALGGAIQVKLRDGRSDSGVVGDVSAGSFGQRKAQLQAGGVLDNGIDWFAYGDAMRETGWRQDSGSRVWHGYGRIGWQSGESKLGLALHGADSRFNGNGLQEFRLLDRDYRSVYTKPDMNHNRGWMAVLNGQSPLGDHAQIRGNLFWRKAASHTLGADVNEGALGQSLYQPNAAERAALAAAGYSGFPLSGETAANTAFPKWRCIANVLINDEPNEKCNGLLNRSSTSQEEWGGNLELTYAPAHGPLRQLTLGGSAQSNRAQFAQTSQFGYLLPDRSVAVADGMGAYADGTQTSENAFDARVDLHSRTQVLGLYALANLQLARPLSLDLAARWDYSKVRNRDRITPGGGTGSLDSNPSYARLNPSAALNWQAGGGALVTLGWSQASRAPSAIELGCSDPESPCRLPNALAGDPPLAQVVAQRMEAKFALQRQHWSLSASAFRTDSKDDILFVTASATGYGYFRNFGQTRRQGIEISGSANLGALRLNASYTLLDATYRSGERVGGSGNSSNEAAAPGFEGSIEVQKGDHILLVPRHLLKAALGWQVSRQIALDLDATASSGVYARGNENNRHRADGTYYLGAGKTDGYVLTNLTLTYQPSPRTTLTLGIRNLLDTRYATGAQLGATAFDANGQFVARPFAGPVIDGERPLLHSTFLAPGAPRAFTLGLRVRM